MAEAPVVDAEAREVRVGERRISLTPREWLLFDYLWRPEGRI